MRTLRGLLLLLLLTLLASAGGAEARSYHPKDQVEMAVNLVGPFHNPAETYRYYSLPFCQPVTVHAAADSLGGALAGDRRRTAMYELHFRHNSDFRSLCRKRLNQNEIKQFRDAILNNWIFELFVDDLSVRGLVGDYMREPAGTGGPPRTQVYLFPHLHFKLAWNDDHVIAVNISTDPTLRVPLEFGQDLEVEFSYSVQWIRTQVRYPERQELHSLAILGEQTVQIHWISILNSLLLVVLLTGVLAAILMRVLRKDLARYMELEDLEFGGAGGLHKGRRPPAASSSAGAGMAPGGSSSAAGTTAADEEESGWKHISSDVFRLPRHLMLFCAALGTGTQLLVMAVSILLLSLIGTLYPTGNRGVLYTAAVSLYALTSGVAGYVSSRLYVGWGGRRWALNGVLTALLFPGPFMVVFIALNTLAARYGSTTALPFAHMLTVLLLWVLVTLPLTALGVSRGRRQAVPYVPPVKPNLARREIPPTPWYRSWPVHVFVGGILPFWAIYVELHYIFAAIWGHHVYTLYGILTIAFGLLVIVAGFISVALTFFQLAGEDWRWWWRSFVAGASTGLFMYIYGFTYFVFRSEMTGTLQTCFFFGYLFVISLAFALMLGTVGWWLSHRFVRYIYSSIKVD